MIVLRYKLGNVAMKVAEKGSAPKASSSPQVRS